MYEIRKFKKEDEWTTWKKVDEATALRKAAIVVKAETGWGDELDYGYFHPYEIRKIEEQKIYSFFI